jgi:predicted ABC-type ATPase
VDPRPSVVILAGPNGAGKSTVAPLLLREARLDMRQFVNADDIARQLSPSDPASVAVPAGREMLSRLHELARQRQSFAFETTLASRHFSGWFEGLLEDGYSLNILFLWLSSPELARARVENRVIRGGHDVPEDIVRRRYTRGLRNFFDLYQSLATTWQMYDSSVPGTPRLIAAGSRGTVSRVSDRATWVRIERGARGRE